MPPDTADASTLAVDQVSVHFGGVAALLGMLNTCSPNVSVVNIDNGFGAACIASLINHL